MSHCHCEEPHRGDVAISLYKSEIASLASCFRKKARDRNDVKGLPAKTGNKPRLNCKAGVTLIELILAMIILAFVALSSAAMIGAQIQGMIASTNLTAAGNLARLEMERLNNIAYAAVASGSTVIAPYTVTRSVATVVGGGGAERKDITLTVQRTGSAAILWTLYGSIANNVVYAP